MAILLNITLRSPFSVIKKPLPACLIGYSQKYVQNLNFWRRIVHVFSSKIINTGINLWGRSKLPAPKGKFCYQLLGTKRILNFNSINSQFAVIYRKQRGIGFTPEISALIDYYVPDDGIFYDVGSNWGYFSLYLASRPTFFGHIYAFEPFPMAFDDLINCVIEADLKDTISCLNIGLSDAERIALISIPKGGHSGTAEINDNRPGEQVLVKRLDDMSLPPPDFIKIDAEGHEAQILRGASGVLMDSKPMIIIESQIYYDEYKKTFQPLCFLTEMGYNLFLPAWSHESNGRKYYLTYPFVPSTSNQQLALIPFSWETRYTIPKQIDLFACHDEKLSELIKT